MRCRLIISGILVLASCSSLWAQRRVNLKDHYQIRIERAVDPILIDGRLREASWANADTASSFWYSYPMDNRRAEPEIQTEVRMTYDDHFIYLAAKCYGRDDYVIQSLKRDNELFWRGDAFAFVIDPVNERTNGFTFGVNPANVQTEALVTGDTGTRGSQSRRGINSAWDNKWFSAIETHQQFWIIEMAIPFKSIRFNDEKSQWGINFIRGEPHSNSYHTWSPVPVQFRGLDLGYTGALIWDEPPRKVKTNFSIIPYVLGSSYRDQEATGEQEWEARTGVDAKVAVTSSLNLDLTVNPDFSQVDVDEQVTNLTAFNIRFPERRLFFLENSDIFEEFGIPPMRPFFSRKIGLDEKGNTIPILFGMRLSGNLNKDLRIGAMNIQTRSTEVDPGQNYTSMAFHQRVLKRSVIKGYYHNRQATMDGGFVKGNFNRVTGLDFNYQSLDGKLRAFAGYGLSLTSDIPNEQNSFYNLGVGYDSRNISVYTNLAGIGDNYYADMGFFPLSSHYDAVRDTSFYIGYQHWFSRMAYTFYPKNQPRVIAHTVGIRNVYDAQNTWELISNSSELQYDLRLQNTSSLALQFNHDQVNLLYPFGFVSDVEPLPARKYTFDYFSVMYMSDTRKVLSFTAGFEYGGFYNGIRTGYTLNLRYRIQPWGNFGINFVQNNLKFPDPYGSENLFLIGPRIEINFNTNLFWTTFLQYNTQQDNFNINSRVQWRFQPMSDVFLVYTDNYAVEYWGPKNRALVLKINYWLNL